MSEEAFILYLDELVGRFPDWTLRDVIRSAGRVERLYLIVVDVLKGFCETGPLASRRVAEMVKPVARLVQDCLEEGMPAGNLVFLNDAHTPYAAEFGAFPPHCIRGSEEAEVMEPLSSFTELHGVQVFHKNATNGMFGENGQGLRFFEWLEGVFSGGPATFIVVGDCTDLCIYQNAMGIRLYANERNAEIEVIVPASHVRTYDLPVEEARAIGALAHDADLLERVFLYHMQLNGIRILRSLRLA
jgi:nicotinamidase-related amidase